LASRQTHPSRGFSLRPQRLSAKQFVPIWKGTGKRLFPFCANLRTSAGKSLNFSPWFWHIRRVQRAKKIGAKMRKTRKIIFGRFAAPTCYRPSCSNQNRTKRFFGFFEKFSGDTGGRGSLISSYPNLNPTPNPNMAQPPVHPVDPVHSETAREILFPFCANPLRAKVLIQGEKIKVNQACSRLIKVNQPIFKHFFSKWFGSNRSGRVKVSQTGSNLASFCLCAFSFLLFLLITPPRCKAEPPSLDPTNEPLKQISRDVFQLGPVRLDKSRKTVQFPAQLNMNDGLIEYLLVNSKGKAYESLLRTDIEPYSIQLAMLLIGAKGAPQTPALLNAPSIPFHVNRPASATNSPPLAIQGDPVTIELAWQTSNGTKQLPAEDCIMNLAARTNASRGPWTYNGSRVVNGFFLAQREGSIVAMIDDIDAMVNNPRPGSDNDQIWQINSNTLPPLNTAVEVTFKLETSTNK
jgi:hypothetical protein